MQPGSRRPRWCSTRRGVSLIELSIAMVVLVIVLGAVLSMQLEGLRIYQRVAAADWATFDAAVAVHRLEEEIEQCFRVTGRYENRITLTHPLTAYDAGADLFLPAQPLAEGESVRYYLSDASGVLGRSGSHLWRATRAAGGSSYVVDPSPLADNIEALEFTYEMLPPPRQASTRYVDVLVRARVKEGGYTGHRTHRARVCLRNATCGPVTAETGADEEE